MNMWMTVYSHYGWRRIWFFLFLASNHKSKEVSKSSQNQNKISNRIYKMLRCIWLCWGNFVDDFLFRYWVELFFFIFRSCIYAAKFVFAIINWDFILNCDWFWVNVVLRKQRRYIRFNYRKTKKRIKKKNHCNLSSNPE